MRAHYLQTWFVVPSTSVGPVGHSQEENYTCVGIAMSRNHSDAFVPVRLYLRNAGKGVLHATHVVLYLSGLQLLGQAAVFLARRVPETNDARAATRVRCAAPTTKSTASTYLGGNRKLPPPKEILPNSKIPPNSLFSFEKSSLTRKSSLTLCFPLRNPP